MADISERIQGAIEAECARHGVPGAAVTVYLDRERVFHGASGVVDPERGDLLDRDALFSSYSVTKTMTAIAALRLAEQGQLDLDATLSRWLPALPFARDVTVRQLLAHTAGVPNYSVIPEQIEALYASPDKAWTFEQFVAATCHRGLDFQPGESWCYSNTGYTLARRILEQTAGCTLGKLIEDTVCRPLGLTRTTQLDSLESLHDLTPGFTAQFSGESGDLRDVRGLYDPGWCGTGVMASTADELCRIFEGLFGGALLTDASFDQMRVLSRVPDLDIPGTASYGLGLMALPDRLPAPEYGHGGGGPGYAIHVMRLEGSRAHPAATLAALCNRDCDAPLAILRAVTDAAALSNSGNPAPVPSPRP